MFQFPPRRARLEAPQEVQPRRERTLAPLPMLRRQIRRHNWQVLGLALLTLAGAAALWLTAYAVAWWLLLLGASAVVKEPHPPAHFREYFLAIAGVLFALAWVHRYLNPDERPRDRKMPSEIALDFLLMPPRLTLAVFGNLSAWLRLSRPELEGAAALIERVRQEKKLPLHAAPLELPEEKSRDRVLLSLLLLRLLEIRKEDGALWLRPIAAEPESCVTASPKRL